MLVENLPVNTLGRTRPREALVLAILRYCRRRLIHERYRSQQAFDHDTAP